MTDRRYTIGVLINRIDGRYESNIWHGLSDYVRTQDLNLIFFVGRQLNDPLEDYSIFNRIYQLAQSRKLDGLIILGGSLGNFLTQEELLDFVQPFRNLPIVNISSILPGIPSVLSEPKSGIYSLFDHLTEKHHFKRIAFLRGPRGNFEAQERFRYYKQYLEEHGLPYDPGIVYDGDFTYDTSRACAEKLIQNKIDFEAIFCANDEMAIAFSHVFELNGQPIPETIALAGYDDIEIAHNLACPLTTIRQPYPELCARACELLIEQLKGNPVPEIEFLQTRLVVRESCGCFVIQHLEPASAITELESGTRSRGETEEVPSLQGMVPEIIQALELSGDQKDNTEKQLHTLLALIQESLKPENSPENYYRSLYQAIKKNTDQQTRSMDWQNVFTLIRSVCIAHLPQAQLQNKLNDLIHHSQRIIGKTMVQRESKHILFLNTFWIT